MRWDPADDRRYALLDADPGPEGSHTVWMANLLAYLALPFFPCAPGRWGLDTTAWHRGDNDEMAFTWPMWEFSASPDTVRSLLQLSQLTDPGSQRSPLRERGIAAIFRSRRIRVPPTGSNYKWNFSQTRDV